MSETLGFTLEDEFQTLVKLLGRRDAAMVMAELHGSNGSTKEMTRCFRRKADRNLKVKVAETLLQKQPETIRKQFKKQAGKLIRRKYAEMAKDPIVVGVQASTHMCPAMHGHSNPRTRDERSLLKREVRRLTREYV